MEQAKGQLFAADLPSGGVTVVVTLVGASLVMEGANLRRKLPCAALSLAMGGFDGRHWRLGWAEGAGEAALLLPPGAASDSLLATLPGPVAAELPRHRRRGRAASFRFRLGLGIVGLILLLPLLLLLAFWLNADRIAGWAADRVDIEQERRLGELAFAQMRPRLKLVERGPAPGLVKAIGDRLTAGSAGSAGSAYSYRWYVAESPEVNAFALPGGHVVVYTGLLKAADSAEEVAGVLAHEAQHVELRHSLRNLIHGLGWRAVLGLALGDLGGNLGGGVWAGLADQLGGMSYSRDLEREADLAGLAALRKAGIAPHGMPSFFAKLARQDGRGIALLSSHPASAERMQALEQAIAARGDYPAAPLPYDWGVFKAELERH